MAKKYTWINNAIYFMENMVDNCCDKKTDFISVRGKWMYGSYTKKLTKLICSDKYIKSQMK